MLGLLTATSNDLANTYRIRRGIGGIWWRPELIDWLAPKPPLLYPSVWITGSNQLYSRFLWRQSFRSHLPYLYWQWRRLESIRNGMLHVSRVVPRPDSLSVHIVWLLLIYIEIFTYNKYPNVTGVYLSLLPSSLTTWSLIKPNNPYILKNLTV